MSGFLKKLLSAFFYYIKRRRFDNISCGEGSVVAWWRIRALQNNMRLTIGGDSVLEGRMAFERQGARISVGDRTFIGNCVISCANEIEIGNDVLIAWNVAIFDHGSHSVNFKQRSNDVRQWAKGQKNWDSVSLAKTKIGDKSWIGYGSIILPGVEVGEGAVVGAGSVVSRDVQPWTIVAGNPARLIREILVNAR